MFIIIDGYNLLKQFYERSTITSQQRQEFLAALDHYAKKKGHSTVIVFDGTEPFEELHKKYSITVVYAGPYQTADDYIKQYFIDHPNKKIMLVSSDRELRSAARRCGIDSLTSPEFMQTSKLLHKRSYEMPEKVVQGPLKKLQLEADEYVDKLMEEAAHKVVYKEIPESAILKKHKAHTVPKKERMRSKVIKKL